MNLLRNISGRVYYVWLRNMVSYQRFILSTFIASLGEPLLYLVAMGIGLGSYMGLIDGMPYLNFIGPGLLVSTAMFAASYECTFGAFVRMTMEKVYNAQLVTPLSVEEVVAGEILWGMTRSLFSGLIMFVVLMFFGIIKFAALPWLLVLWLALGFISGSMSMVVTAYAPNFDFFTYYMELFISPMFLFSGIFFPLDKFPAVAKLIANFLPLTHAVVFSRAVVYGQLKFANVANLLALIIPGFLFFVWSLVQMKKRLIK